MLQRIANWHGEQAASFYLRWVKNESDADLRDYCRHASIAMKMWKALGK